MVGQKGNEDVVLSEDLFDGLHCSLRSTIALRIVGLLVTWLKFHRSAKVRNSAEENWVPLSETTVSGTP